MIAAPLLAAMSQAAPIAQDDAEIVVVGHRLAGIAVTVSRDARGKFGCSLSESSGHANLDAQLCRSAAQCVRKGAADSAAVKACVDNRKPALLDDFRRSWKGGAQ